MPAGLFATIHPIMKSATSFAVVLVTAPDLKTARALAQAVLQERLAACVNLVPKIESHYWWQGKLERAGETLMVLKTTRAKLAALERRLLARHPYDTAEVLVLPLRAGSARYLDWLADSVRTSARPAKAH
jgi:periplasmic divalent cation tolerance protein